MFRGVQGSGGGGWAVKTKKQAGNQGEWGGPRASGQLATGQVGPKCLYIYLYIYIYISPHLALLLGRDPSRLRGKLPL